MPLEHPRAPLALRTVADACRAARSIQDRLDEVRRITKDDRSPVTVADFAVQALVAMDLAEGEESPLIVGEERADVLRAPEQAPVLAAVTAAVGAVRPGATAEAVLAAIDRCDHDGTADAYWALDPIDGTKGFLRGQQYAIALGRIERGEVVLGVLGCPNLPVDQGQPLDVADGSGSIYAAAAADGAWEMPAGGDAAAARRVQAAVFDGSRGVRACESVEAAHSKQDDTARILEALGGAGAPVRLDSQCKYAVVARGQADAYLRLPTKKGYVEKIWDHAAGSLVAREAGAVVTDITGARLDFTHGRTLVMNRGIVCAAAALHGRIVDAIDRLGLGAAL